MRIIFIYFLTLSIIVCSDNEDIVETNIVNLKEYSVDKSSYCKDRAEPKNLVIEPAQIKKILIVIDL